MAKFLGKETQLPTSADEFPFALISRVYQTSDAMHALMAPHKKRVHHGNVADFLKRHAKDAPKHPIIALHRTSACARPSRRDPNPHPY